MSKPSSFDSTVNSILALGSGSRKIIAIAGPPGSGKTTMAFSMAAQINQMFPGRSSVLQMDGFHYDDSVLRDRKRLQAKGAPDTFDIGGLKAMLSRLKSNSEPEVAVPVFDREIEVSRAGAFIIPSSVEIILVEGNYILMETGGWENLADFFDRRILVSVSEPELANRLRKRWEDLGLEEDVVTRKLEENDLPNGRFVYANSSRYDILLDGEGALPPAADQSQ